MGQYFKIVNKTKKQVLEPMTFNSGCKHGEIIANSSNGSVLQALGHLITTCDRGWGEKDIKGTWAGDEIIMVGDYHESELYDKSYNARWYKDISEEVMFELFHDRVEPTTTDSDMPDNTAHTKGFCYSWMGMEMQEWLIKYGTETLYGERKRLLLKWFPVACHEGNLRQKYNFVEKEQEVS